MPGYLQREKSIRGDDKLRIQPHAHSIKMVEELMSKFKKRREARMSGDISELGEDEEHNSIKDEVAGSETDNKSPTMADELAPSSENAPAGSTQKTAWKIKII